MKEQIERLIELWIQERAFERAREAEERAATSVRDRVDRGKALAGVEIDETAAVSGGRVMLWIAVPGTSLAGFRASQGAPVVLWHEAPDAPTSVRGILGRRKSGRIGVVVDELPDERFFTGVFNLDVESPEVTFTRGERALRTLLGTKPASELGRLARALFGDELRVEALREQELEFFDESLNEPQRDAVRRALFTEPVALIHGPPGTGKTRTLVEVVRQFVRQGKRVIVTAASNAAVDTLAERLVEAGVELVRIGHPARVAPSVEARTLDSLLEARPDFALARGWIDEANALRRRTFARSDRGSLSRSERREALNEARRLMSDARNHLRGIEDAIVSKADVVACTAASADSAVLGDRTFDVVIVDEATQSADPITAVTLLRAPRVVLAGDPQQLPPTILDPDAARAGLGVTLLERHATHASLLVVQHRMHERIMRFPSDSKYEGKLVAHDAVAGHALPVDDPLRPGPLVFVDTAGKGWDEEVSADDTSTRNPAQAARTAAEVRRLLSRGVAPEDVAVITPYYAQVRLLRDLLPIEELEIDTVDGFQGREKEAVVVDLVRSNERGEIGFLADTRRMNVALTRARRFLLVIGDSATIGGNPYYSDFLEYVETHGAWVSAWSDDAPTL